MQIKDKKQTCFALIGVFIVFFACIGIIRLSNNISYSSKMAYYDLNWNIIINERNYGKHGLSSFVFPPLERNSIITMTASAPELQNDGYTNLELEIDDCAVEVFHNQKCVLSKSMSRYLKHKYIGSGLLNVPLVGLKHGDTIKIKLYVNENNAFKWLRPVRFTSMTDCFANYVRENLFIFVCNIFLLVFGLIGSILSFVLWTYRKQAMSLLVLAQLVFWSSICIFCKHRFVQFFSLNFALNTIVAYFALEIALICVFLLYYLCFANEEIVKKIYKIVIRILSVVFIAFWILHYTDVWHLAKQIVIIRGFLIFLGVYGFSVSCAIIIIKPLEKCVSALGFLLLCIFFIYDYVYYFVFFVTMGSFAFNRNNWFVFGVISLTVCIIIYFVFQLVSSAVENVGTHVDEQSKSVDFVTNVLTRDAIIEKFKHFESLDKSYAVVAIDFLNMPDVSTKAGAEAFYEAISFFAGLIKHVFGIVSEIGRISNTGFIVLSTEITEKRLQQMLLVFQNILNSNNKHDKSMTVLTGTAFSYEMKDSDCHALYSLALQRRSVLGSEKHSKK